MSNPDVAIAPEWGNITEEILCPLCDYNLRGVAEPRCAECGYRFEWADMLDPQRRQHPFLFEHHPRHKLRAFLATVFWTWRPWSFWKGVHACHLLFVRRITYYWILCIMPWFLISLGAWTYLLSKLYFDLSRLAKPNAPWTLMGTIDWHTKTGSSGF